MSWNPLNWIPWGSDVGSIDSLQAEQDAIRQREAELDARSSARYGTAWAADVERHRAEDRRPGADVHQPQAPEARCSGAPPRADRSTRMAIGAERTRAMFETRAVFQPARFWLKTVAV